MRHCNKFILIAVLLAALTGCAFMDGFSRGFSGSEGGDALLNTAGEVAGKTVRDTVPFLPSPWREIIVGCFSGVAGWIASAKRKAK